MMRQRQRELLQALYEDYHGVLRSAAYGRGILSEEADDIVQDTFCAFMEAYGDEFADWSAGRIKATLLKILYNRCIDHFRDRQRHPNVSIQDFLQESEFSLMGTAMSVDIEKRLENQEMLARIRKGIAAMSYDMQKVAVLCLIEERSVEEVSRRLGISVPACRMRVSRIRKRLYDWMENPGTA